MVRIREGMVQCKLRWVRGSGSVWLVDRKDIEEEEDIEGASYDTPRYLKVLYSNVCLVQWFKGHLLQKKVRLTYF